MKKLLFLALITSLILPGVLFAADTSYAASLAALARQIENLRAEIMSLQSTQAIHLVAPNGGETWYSPARYTISWKGNPGPVEIWLAPYYPPCATNPCPLYAIRPPLLIARGDLGYSYRWIAGKIWTAEGLLLPSVPDGQYKIEVCTTGSHICDSSDLPFNIEALKLN